MNELLKSSASIIIKPIYKLFNMCLDTSIIQMSGLVAIFKVSTQKNYPLVTINNCHGKSIGCILNEGIFTFRDLKHWLS